MKKTFLVASALFFIVIGHAQYGYNNLNSELINKSIAAISDNSGNEIIYGSFSTSITFDNLTMTNSTPFDPSGQNQYASYIGKRTGGAMQWLSKIDLLPLNQLSLVQINSIKADVSGNILMTGIFGGKISLGNIILTSTIFNSPYGPYYSTDMFTAKMSPNGFFQWAKLEGNSNRDCNGNEMGISLDVDNLGNVYVAGHLYDKELKGANTCTCNTNTPVSSAVIIKYNSAGIKQWDKRYSPTQPSKNDCNPGCTAWRVVAEGNSAYVTGTIQNSVKFGNITLNTGSDIRNTFILKLDVSGNPVWAKLLSNCSNGNNALIIDNGNLYLIGSFGPGTINFGGPTLTATTSAGYMAKFNLSGVCSWATMPGIISPNGNLIVNSNGNLAILRDYTLKEYSTTNGSDVDSTVSSNVPNSKIIGYPKLSRTPNGYMISEDLRGSYDYAGLTVSSTQSIGSSYSDLILITYTAPASPITRKGNVLEEASSSGVVAYPNPVSSQLNIHNNNNKMLGDLSVYDASGRLIFKKFVGNSQISIDVTRFNAGIYFLKADELQASIKFVRQ